MDFKKLAAASAIALAPFSVLACAGNDGNVDAANGAEEADSLSSTSTFFIVSHIDTRKCAFPACGGVFVERVNKTSTQCADGTYASECHVAQYDLSAIGLSDAEKAKTEGIVADGHALVRGSIVMMPVSGSKISAPTLVATEVWVGNALSTPSGDFYKVTDNGVRCVAAPCAHVHEAKLNLTSSKNVADVDFAASGANSKQVAAAQAALNGDGVLVAGTNTTVHGPAGNGLKLVATEFYTRLIGAPQPKKCGGIAGFQCDPGQVCDITVPNACHGADRMGTCITVPQICYQLFAPVCGCDGKVYANDCFRQTRLSPFPQRIWPGMAC